MASPLDNALRLVKPGEMVVSVQDIFATIGDKLNADEKQQLLIALLSRRVERVRPGDLITSDLFNQLLADTADLQQRLADMQQAASTEKPAIGIISVTRVSGTDKLVPGVAQSQTFRVVNDTDTALRINLAATASAPSGKWSNVAVFENGAAAVAVSIPPGRDLAVLLKVTAPAGAVVGETAELMVTADVGAPHNKHDSSTVKLPLALDGGPVLNHTLEISSPNLPADFTTPPPPAGVDGQIPKTKARTISFPVKHDTDAPDEDPGFVCSVTLDAPQPDVTALGKWVVQINGSSQLTDTTDQAKKLRTLSMPVTLTPKQPLALNVGLTVPNEDIGARLTMAVRSTKLTSTLEKSSQPLVIRTR